MPIVKLVKPVRLYKNKIKPKQTLRFRKHVQIRNNNFLDLYELRAKNSEISTINACDTKIPEIRKKK